MDHPRADTPCDAAEDTSGLLSDIQRFSLHDGPGIRTTVFLKGCPLRCLWCHNPESQRAEPELSFTENLCMGCGACMAACPAGVIRPDGDGRPVIARARCRRCFACAAVCPARALERVGRAATAREVLDEVEADRPFYEESGGGLTLSGGEPLAQPAFGRALLAGARARGLHTCVETCAYAPWAVVDAWRPAVDRWLCDWKETDPERHRTWTGVDNRPIRENLLRLDRAGARISLRCPLVPGANLRPDHLEGIARLSNELTHCDEVVVMRYHRLGEGKRGRFGLDAGRVFEPDGGAAAHAVESLEALGAKPPRLS